MLNQPNNYGGSTTDRESTNRHWNRFLDTYTAGEYLCVPLCLLLGISLCGMMADGITPHLLCIKLLKDGRLCINDRRHQCNIRMISSRCMTHLKSRPRCSHLLCFLQCLVKASSGVLSFNALWGHRFRMYTAVLHVSAQRHMGKSKSWIIALAISMMDWCFLSATPHSAAGCKSL